VRGAPDSDNMLESLARERERRIRMGLLLLAMLCITALAGTTIVVAPRKR
jgi:hypothetical protein